MNMPQVEIETARPVEHSAKLILKPGRVLMEVGQFVQFQAFNRAFSGEMALHSGVHYSSSNPAVALTNGDDGSTILAGVGSATITAFYGQNTATANVVVVQSMAATPVQIVICVDNSESMRERLGTALEIAEAFAASINTTKDSVALFSFTSDSEMIRDMAAAPLLPSDFEKIKASNGKTDITSPAVGTLDQFSVTPPTGGNFLLIISDGSDYTTQHSFIDENLAFCDAFKRSGGVIAVVSIDAFDFGFDLLQKMATPGYFISVMNHASSFELVEGLLGWYCGFYPTNPKPLRAVAAWPNPWKDVEKGNIKQRYAAGETVRADVSTGKQSIVPLIRSMISSVSADGTVSAGSQASTSYAWLAFANSFLGWISQAGVTATWIQFQFNSAEQVTAYEMTFGATPPTAWQFQGSPDGVNWTVLDNQTNFVSAVGQKTRFEIANLNSYAYYRVNITAGITGAIQVGLQRLQFYGAGGPINGYAEAWSDFDENDAQNKASSLAGLIANSFLNPKSPRLPGVAITPGSGAIGAGINLNFTVAGYPNARVRYTMATNVHPQAPSFDAVPSPAAGVEWNGQPVAIAPLSGFTDKLYVRAVARYCDHMDSIYTEAVFTKQ